MENENNVVKNEKPKKKWYFKLLIILAILGVIIILIGFLFPGLLWTKNLGVTYTKEDYKSVMEKLQYVTDPAPKGTTPDDYEYKYGELQDVDIEFSSEELTAFFNENRPDYFAVKNVQIKINNDGTIEASGSANVDYFLNNVLTGKYSVDQIEKEMPALGLLPKNVNLYVKVNGSITDNKTTIGFNDASVQGVPISSSLYDSSEAISTVSSGLNKLMEDFNAKTGSDFYKIFVENGRIKFQAKVISSLERIKKQ